MTSKQAETVIHKQMKLATKEGYAEAIQMFTDSLDTAETSQNAHSYLQKNVVDPAKWMQAHNFLAFRNMSDLAEATEEGIDNFLSFVESNLYSEKEAGLMADTAELFNYPETQLSFLHYQALTEGWKKEKFADKEQLELVLKQAAHEGWSVEALKAHIRKVSQTLGESPGASGKTQVRFTYAAYNTQEDLDAYAAEMMSSFTVWHKDYIEELKEQIALLEVED